MVYKDLEKKKITKKAADIRYRRNHTEQARARKKRWIEANPEKLASQYLGWKIRNPEKCILRAARERAKSKGIEFSIVEEDIVIPDVCPLLNIPLESSIGKGGASNNSPSLDRIDNTKGYVKGNVWVISFLANSVKRNLSLEQLETLVRNLRTKIESIRE